MSLKGQSRSLKNRRFPERVERKKRGRGFKPGISIRAEDFIGTDNNQASSSTQTDPIEDEAEADVEPETPDQHDDQVADETLQNAAPDKNINKRDYVLVAFICENKKDIRYFAGEVTDISDSAAEITVNFLRKKALKDIYFVFPDVKDQQTVPKKDIIAKLPLKRVARGRFYFQLPHCNLE